MADQYYIESDYFTPDAGYFVYTADAVATISSSASVTCVIGRLQSASATVSAYFTPSLTVDILRNHTALIDAVVTLSVDPVVNRSITQTLDSIANVNAMANRTRDISASISSAVSISATIGLLQTASATVTSTSTLSANGLNLQFASATISTTATLYCKPYVTWERPLQIQYIDGQYTLIDTSIKKFGSGSLSISGVTFRYYALPTWHHLSDEVNIDFWMYQNTTSSTFGLIKYQDTSFSTLWNIERITSGNLRVTVGNGVGTTATNSLTSNNWHHISVSFSTNSNKFSAWINGTRVINQTTFTSLTANNNNKYLVFDTGSIANPMRYDEVHIRYGSGGMLAAIGRSLTSSTITVPTEPYTNDVNYTGFLGHFNYETGFADDVSITQIASATLSSTASLSVTITPLTKQASATLSSTASLSASITRTRYGSAALDSTATLSATAYRQQQGSADLNAAVTLSAIIGSIKHFESTELSAFDTSAICQAQLAGVALLETFSTLSANIIKTADGVQSLSSAFTLSAIPTTTSGASVDLSVTVTLTANDIRIRYFDATLDSSLSLSADATKYRQFAAILSSEFTQSLAIDHYVGFIVLEAGSFSLNAVISRTRNVNSTQTSTVTLSATAYRQQHASANLTSTATVTANVNRIPGWPLNLYSEFTTIVNASKTAVGDVSLEAIATELTAAFKNATGTVTIQATASLTTSIGRIIQYPKPAITGVEVYANNKYPKIRNNFSSFSFAYPSDSGFTLSIWARRNTVTGNFQPLVSDDPSDVFAFTLYGDDFLLRQNFDPDEPNGYWINQVPTDTDWHHFLFYDRNITSGGVRQYQLWIDGVYAGLTETIVYPSGRFTYNDYTELGRATLAQLTNPYSTANYYLDGSLAQIWIGQISGTINPTLFYDNGPIDFGSNGRGPNNLLPTPLVYSALTQPYTDVTFVGGYTTAEKPASESLYYNNIVGYFALTATAQVAIVTTVNLTSQASLTANAIKQVIGSATLNSSATLSVTANAYTGIIAGLTATTSLSATPYRIQTETAALQSTATLTVITGFEKQFASLEMSAATLVCDITVIFPIRTSADLTSTFALTADAIAFSGIAAIMEVFATVTCDITVKPPVRITADLTSTTTLTVTVGAVEQFAVLIASSGTMTASATRIQSTSAVLQSTATLTAVGGKTVGITAILSAQGFILTVGTIINIDPYLTLVVKPESRWYYVLPENRTRIIESETRVNIV